MPPAANEHGAHKNGMAHPRVDHPPEELLEVLVLAAEELSPALHDAVTAHARGCVLCRSVLGLLLQFHRAVDAEAASSHPDALVRTVFAEEQISDDELRAPARYVTWLRHQ